ncbi:MAG: SemiSWEET transporter [Acidobacteriota bacterium]
MTESWVSLMGFAAGALTAFAFFPQVVRTCRTRSAGDLSTVMLGAQSTGVALWIVYGVALRAAPIILANTVTLVLSLTLLLCKRVFRPAG